MSQTLARFFDQAVLSADTARSTPRIFGLLALGAVLLMLAFPYPGWAVLAHIALVPLAIVAGTTFCTRRMLLAAWIIGLAWWLIMFRWLIPVTFAGWIGACMVFALYWPFALLLMRRMAQQWALPMTLAVPLAWVACEALRGAFPANGFTWFRLAHTQAPFLPEHGVSYFIQVADLQGELAVSFLVALTSGLLADVLILQRGRRQTLSICLAVWVLAIGGAHLYGHLRIPQIENATRAHPLQITIIQTNVPQDNKERPTRDIIRRDWQDLVRLTTHSVEQDQPDAVLWPETVIPRPINPEAVAFYRDRQVSMGDFHTPTATLARELGVELIAGGRAEFDLREVEVEPGYVMFLPGRRYNAAFLYQRDGTQHPSRYDKMHRVPFGEYIPWVERWPWLKRQFTRYFTPYDVDYTIARGEDPVVFMLSSREGDRRFRVVTPICFEDAVPRVARTMVYEPGGVRRADIMLNLTNDGWFAGSVQPFQHMQLATLRCVELRTPMARSVNTGVSGAIDGTGRVTAMVEVSGRHRDVAGHVTVDVHPVDVVSSFGRVGVLPTVVLTVLAFVLGLIPRLPVREPM